MKHLLFSIALFFACTLLQAQSEVERIIREGIEYHDDGEFDKAIETYNRALVLDPKSSLIHYELSLSYFSNGDFKKAIKHADVVLKKKGDHLTPAYVTKGSSLDNLGKSKKAIKLFEKAIAESEEHYLLYFNLALTYFKIEEYGKAATNTVRAISQKPNHASSHLMLAKIYDKDGRTVQPLLASHFFLLLEPNTRRSLEAYEILQRKMGGNISKDSEKPNTININVMMNNDDTQMGAAELMVSMMAVSNSLEENEGKTEEEMFVENTESFFTTMSELRKEESQDIWWNFYTPFFAKLVESDHLETYCGYITQVGNEEYGEWLEENKADLEAFSEWLKEN